MRRVHRGDTIASALILLLLASIAGWVAWRGAHAPSGHSREQDLKDAFKPPQTLAGYTLRRLEYFTSANLHEYINGQAPRYFQFGFKSLTVAEFFAPKTKGASLVVDLYNMGARHNAYGIWIDGRGEEEADLKAGNAGYTSGNMAAFWKGTWFVRIRALTDEDQSRLVQKAAEEAAEWIDDGAGQLEEFAAFPKDGLVAGAQSYQNEAAFGLAYLNGAFVSEYDLQGRKYRLFYADAGDAAKAVQLLREHAKFLASGGKVEASKLDGAELFVWGKEKYTGPSYFAARGGIVAGCFGLDDRATAEALVKALLTRVKAPTKAAGAGQKATGAGQKTTDGARTTGDDGGE